MVTSLEQENLRSRDFKDVTSWFEIFLNTLRWDQKVWLMASHTTKFCLEISALLCRKNLSAFYVVQNAYITKVHVKRDSLLNTTHYRSWRPLWRHLHLFSSNSAMTFDQERDFSMDNDNEFCIPSKHLDAVWQATIYSIWINTFSDRQRYELQLNELSWCGHRNHVDVNIGPGTGKYSCPIAWPSLYWLPVYIYNSLNKTNLPLARYDLCFAGVPLNLPNTKAHQNRAVTSPCKDPAS